MRIFKKMGILAVFVCFLISIVACSNRNDMSLVSEKIKKVEIPADIEREIIVQNGSFPAQFLGDYESYVFYSLYHEHDNYEVYSYSVNDKNTNIIYSGAAPNTIHTGNNGYILMKFTDHILVTDPYGNTRLITQDKIDEACPFPFAGFDIERIGFADDHKIIGTITTIEDPNFTTNIASNENIQTNIDIYLIVISDLHYQKIAQVSTLSQFNDILYWASPDHNIGAYSLVEGELIKEIPLDKFVESDFILEDFYSYNNFLYFTQKKYGETIKGLYRYNMTDDSLDVVMENDSELLIDRTQIIYGKHKQKWSAFIDSESVFYYARSFDIKKYIPRVGVIVYEKNGDISIIKHESLSALV